MWVSIVLIVDEGFGMMAVILFCGTAAVVSVLDGGGILVGKLLNRVDDLVTVEVILLYTFAIGRSVED